MADHNKFDRVSFYSDWRAVCLDCKSSSNRQCLALPGGHYRRLSDRFPHISNCYRGARLIHYHPAALAVHADLDIMDLKYIGEALTGKLTALITVEDLGWPVGRQYSKHRHPVIRKIQ